MNYIINKYHQLYDLKVFRLISLGWLLYFIYRNIIYSIVFTEERCNNFFLKFLPICLFNIILDDSCRFRIMCFFPIANTWVCGYILFFFSISHELLKLDKQILVMYSRLILLTMNTLGLRNHWNFLIRYYRHTSLQGQ